ncbi:MAG: hypothetical protein RL745_290 [Actinomycetota bacterium]|jgi:hypothetical protein
MSDEMTPDTQETAQTETAPPSGAVVDMDARVRAGGNEIPVADLLKAKEELEYLKQDYSKLVSFRDATAKVMRPDVDPGVKEQAARQLLLDMGYRGNEVEQYVQDWMSSQQGGNMTDEPTDNVGGDDNDKSAEQVAEAIMAAQRQAQQAQEELQRMKAEQLNSRLNAQIVMGLEGNQGARTMLNKLKEINGKDALTSARAAIERDIRQQTLDNLRSRRTAAGVFEEAWISEESARATEQVLAKYRSVIGDPNRLGRAPETDSGASAILNRPAVQAPRWKPGSNNGDIESALDAFNKDALSRLAAELDSGSDTRA